MDAHIGMVVTVAPHRHHLRAKLLRDALRGVPYQPRRYRVEGKAQRLRRTGQGATSPVGQAAGRDTQRVLGLGGEASTDPQRLAVIRATWSDMKVVDRRGNAQGVARLKDIQWLRRRGKIQHDGAALDASAGIVRIAAGCAQRQPVGGARHITVTTIQIGQRERRGGA